MKKIHFTPIIILTLLLGTGISGFATVRTFVIETNKIYAYTPANFSPQPGPGDLILIKSSRSAAIKFIGFEGSAENPIIVQNAGGTVQITTTGSNAVILENCKYLKISGKGEPQIKFGFRFQGNHCCLGLSEYSTNIEVENIEIAGAGSTFFGIVAKMDFFGDPPEPIPIFDRLIIHDCYVHDVTEGMYIGETTSPGMEFRNVRVYNNVVSNTGRESIQLANCVENVKVYNNYCSSAGLDGELYHMNNFQLGDNSVAEIYNNIFLDAPEYGAIIFGLGAIDFHHNYVKNNKGIFIDNRLVTLPDSDIKVRNSYFSTSTSWEIVKNMNELCNLYITDNYYDTSIPFFQNIGEEPPFTKIENNKLGELPELKFEVIGGVFDLSFDCAVEYENYGPVEGLGHDFNPEIPLEIRRIELDPSMLIDMVPGGSKVSPKYLVDEQDLDPFSDELPLSRYWKPMKRWHGEPIHLIIDLGSEIDLTSIGFYNVGRKGPLLVEAGEPDSWTEIFSESCKNRNKWILNDVELNTQYLRLTMVHTGKVRINELAIYGYLPAQPVSKDIDDKIFVKNQVTGLKSGSISRDLAPVDLDLLVYPNPVSDLLNIKNFEAGMRVNIYDSKGRLVESGSRGQINLLNVLPGWYSIVLFDAHHQVLKRMSIIKQ